MRDRAWNGGTLIMMRRVRCTLLIHTSHDLLTSKVVFVSHDNAQSWIGPDGGRADSDLGDSIALTYASLNELPP